MADDDEAYELAQADLARSGISDNSASLCGLTAVANAQDVIDGAPSVPATVFPYLNRDRTPMLDEHGEPFVRVRLHWPPMPKGFATKGPQKYTQGKGTGVHPYFPALLDWSQFDEKAGILIVTEGEKKAIKTCEAGFWCVGLGGVDNFMQDGQFLPELAALPYKAFCTYIIFDSDAANNSSIAAAEEKLVREISTKRFGDVRIVRLPAAKDANGKTVKVGLDDYLLTHTAADLQKLMDEAKSLAAMDKAVLALNEHVCYIAEEEKLYKFAEDMTVSVARFAKGDQLSSEKVIVPNKSKPGTSSDQIVAEKWLNHPLARRYEKLVFEPTADREIPTETGLHYNAWRGLSRVPTVDADVQPFIDLTRKLFSRLPEKYQDHPLKLMAYKAQNPKAKLQWSLFMLGKEGAGKSLWATAICNAFGDYARPIDGALLEGGYNGYNERTLMLFVDEAEKLTKKTYALLKTSITNVQQNTNEKYKVSKKTNSYSAWMFATNKPSAAQFAKTDRRFFVVEVFSPPLNQNNKPSPEWDAWMRPIVNFIAHDPQSGPKIMDYLLRYPLNGWEPESHAPQTAAKTAGYQEGQNPIQRLADRMIVNNDQNIIGNWIREAAAYWTAQINGGAQKPNEVMAAENNRATLLGLGVRPWYTAPELAIIFPLVAASYDSYAKLGTLDPGVLQSDLREAGIPLLQNSDPDETNGFRRRNGVFNNYLLVMPSAAAYAGPISQEEFETQMDEFAVESKELLRGLK